LNSAYDLFIRLSNLPCFIQTLMEFSRQLVVTTASTMDHEGLVIMPEKEMAIPEVVVEVLDKPITVVEVKVVSAVATVLNGVWVQKTVSPFTC